MRFVDLFAGLGGFHIALESLGGECVYAIELDDELRNLYVKNFGLSPHQLGVDITSDWKNVPAHDVLCAGFPCQPFSKSGKQLGRADLARGTLFDYVVKIAKVHRPKLILLENVGNFERHDKGNTWRTVKSLLSDVLKYEVVGTINKSEGGSGLISPHDFGFPQRRDRFFVVAARDGFVHDPIPMPHARARKAEPLKNIVTRVLSVSEKTETKLSDRQRDCINHWNQFIQHVPKHVALPSFPIWADEFEAMYPVTHYLTESTRAELRGFLGPDLEYVNETKVELLKMFPRYMTNGTGELPAWKRRFLEQNRQFYADVKKHLPSQWLQRLRDFPLSLRKLEWNAKGEERDLWQCVLQFRPSGLRAKRYTSVPALVAMTTTQIPILGPERRFLTRGEGLLLQGMPDTHALPESREAAFRALGNAVHVGVVQEIYRGALKAMPHKKTRSRRESSRKSITSKHDLRRKICHPAIGRKKKSGR